LRGVKLAQLQWSRFFSKRKMPDECLTRSGGSLGFNGAAFFQSGKSSPITLPSGGNDAASMEPLFFKAENGGKPEKRSLAKELQWSRFFSKRKMLSVRQRAFEVHAASMEPLFFKAENVYCSPVRQSP